MKRGFVMVVVAGILIGEVASAEQDGPNLKDPKMIAAGHNLFLAKQCAHCHGEDGRGGIDLTQRELYPKDIFQSIADGREKKGVSGGNAFGRRSVVKCATRASSFRTACEAALSAADQ